ALRSLLQLPRPPTSPLFPSPTLFRSLEPMRAAVRGGQRAGDRVDHHLDGRRLGFGGRGHARLWCAGASAIAAPFRAAARPDRDRSEEHTSELQSLTNLVSRLLLPKQK